MPDPGVPSGDPRKLNPPPKFGTVSNGGSPAPKGIGDWVAFFRWLFSLWRVASVSIDAGEAITITQRPGASGSDQETLGAAVAMSEARPGPQGSRELDLAEIRGKQYRGERPVPPDDLNAVSLMALTKTPYPFPVPQGSDVIEATHAYRSTLVTVDVTAGAVARTAGDFFFAAMVGKKIALAPAGLYTLYTVLTYVDASHITIDPSVTVVAAPLFFQFYPSVQSPEGTFFWETDRTLLYLSVTELGVVDTAGTLITWAFGPFFNPYWAGHLINIGGTVYPIVAVTSPTTMTIGTSAGTFSFIPYTVESGAWQYVAGQHYATLANIPSLGMGSRDTGVLFEASDYKHMYRWTGTVWDYAPGDPGSAYIVGTQGSAPAGGLWGKCDGTTYTRSTPTGGTASFATRDLTNGDFLKAGNAGHAAAVAPTLAGGAHTDDATSVFAGGAVTVGVGDHNHEVTIPGDTATLPMGGSSFAFPGVYATTDNGAHDHSITNADAPQSPHQHTLSTVTINANGTPASSGLDWYVRL